MQTRLQWREMWKGWVAPHLTLLLSITCMKSGLLCSLCQRILWRELSQGMWVRRGHCVWSSDRKLLMSCWKNWKRLWHQWVNDSKDHRLWTAEHSTGYLFCCFADCRPGRYGPNCQFYCDCDNGAACDPTSGDCTCQVGWVGPTCSQGGESMKLWHFVFNDFQYGPLTFLPGLNLHQIICWLGPDIRFQSTWVPLIWLSRVIWKFSLNVATFLESKICSQVHFLHWYSCSIIKEAKIDNCFLSWSI